MTDITKAVWARRVVARSRFCSAWNVGKTGFRLRQELQVPRALHATVCVRRAMVIANIESARQARLVMFRKLGPHLLKGL